MGARKENWSSFVSRIRRLWRTQGGRAAYQIRANARFAVVRSRWSLEFAQEDTILADCSAELTHESFKFYEMTPV